EQPDDRVVVRVDDLVVELRPEADERRVGDVHEQEKQNRDAGDAVERPRPLALTALVHGPEPLGKTRHARVPFSQNEFRRAGERLLARQYSRGDARLPNRSRIARSLSAPVECLLWVRTIALPHPVSRSSRDTSRTG